MDAISARPRMDKPEAIDIFFGKKVRQMREYHSMSKADLGLLLNVDWKHIEAIETGVQRPTVSQRFALSQIFDRPISAFYSDADICASESHNSPAHVPPADTLQGRLLRHFNNIIDPTQQEAFVAFAAAMASSPI